MYCCSHSLLLLLINKDSGNNTYCTITYKCNESVGYFVCVCVFSFLRKTKKLCQSRPYMAHQIPQIRGAKKKKKVGSIEPEGYVCYFIDLELQVFRS